MDGWKAFLANKETFENEKDGLRQNKNVLRLKFPLVYVRVKMYGNIGSI